METRHDGAREDESGHPIAHQWISPTTEVTDRQRLVARIELPPFGYRQIRIRQGSEDAAGSDLRASDRTIENQHLRMTVKPDGGIDIFDKIAQREVFTSDGGARPLFWMTRAIHGVTACAHIETRSARSSMPLRF